MIKDGLYDKAKLAPSPNKGGFIKPRLIIVHDTAGGLDAAGSVSWLRNPVAKVSAHFVVARDGTITQLVSCNLKAWHAGKSSYNGVMNVNDFSIGIEIVNPGALSPAGPSSARASFGATFKRSTFLIEELPDQRLDAHGVPSLNPAAPRTHPAGLWMPYPQAQLDAVLALCLDIREAYGIAEVAPHWYISPGRKVDTNPLFPLRWLQGKLEGRANPETLVLKPVEPTPISALPQGPTPDWIKDPLTSLPHIRIKAPGLLRRWPTCFPSNVLDYKPDAVLEVISEGLYDIQGEDIPEDLARCQLVWYRVKYNEDDHCFVLKANTELV